MKTKDFYLRHCENLRMIERAITSVQRTLRSYVRRDESDNIYIYTKVLSHLVNTWAEIRLLKVIYEKHAFSNPDKDRILKAGSAKERWQTALKIAFSKAYNVAEKKLDNIDKNIDIPLDRRTRYKTLLGLINEELLVSTQLRNRISHGQWKYAFNEELTDFQDDLTAKLRQENIVQLQLRYKMFISLGQIIQDLAVSKPAFERDFNMHYRKIEGQKTNFHNRTYEEYKKMLIRKRERYLQKKQLNHNAYNV